MINEKKDHFVLIDKCAEETRIVEVNEGKIVKFTSWIDQKPPLIGSIFNARIIKKRPTKAFKKRAN